MSARDRDGGLPLDRAATESFRFRVRKRDLCAAEAEPAPAQGLFWRPPSPQIIQFRAGSLAFLGESPTFAVKLINRRVSGPDVARRVPVVSVLFAHALRISESMSSLESPRYETVELIDRCPSACWVRNKSRPDFSYTLFANVFRIE